ncbi:MAG TPA: DUF4097 family beta strand repeat-containing protein [Longimicrobium sp.]|nr:DUF4097 family beta strand repeat-containing protein [Longimicrobium sp.]
MRYTVILAAAATVAGFALPHDSDAKAGKGGVLTMQAVQAVAKERAAPAQGAAASRQDFRWAGRISRGDAIEIRGVVGDITAEVTGGDQVEVVAMRRGADADEVRIEVDQHEDGVTICAIYPHDHGDWNEHRGRTRDRDRDDDDDNDPDDDDDRRVRSRGGNGPCDSEHRRGHDGDHRHGDDDHDDMRVDFVVKVPAGVRFVGRTVSGDVEAEGLRSEVDVATVAGDVRIATTEAARAASVSGNIEAQVGRAMDDDMHFTTVAGNVDLRVDGDVNADLHAQTLTGEIDANFPVEREAMARAGGDDNRWGINIKIGQEARARLGRGGSDLEITTVSGNIRLARGR